MSKPAPPPTRQPGPGGLFYLAFYRKTSGSPGQRFVTRYNYDPGGYPQFNATFEQWRQRCIDQAKASGAEFLGDADPEEY